MISNQSLLSYTYIIFFGRSELHWNFSSIPKDGSGFDGFPTTEHEVGLNSVHCCESVNIRFLCILGTHFYNKGVYP